MVAEEAKMVLLRVNGKSLSAKGASTILETARKAGIEIPTLCYHPALPPGGACRICLVEEESTGRLLTACNTRVEGGMSILTDTQRVSTARQRMLELIFARHPVDCTICEAANTCRLRLYAARYGVSGEELPRRGELRTITDANALIQRDYSKCIGCGICVRACGEVQGAAAVEFVGSGPRYRPATTFDHPLDASECELCGLCVSLCPVGALMEKPSMHHGLETRRVGTVCPYCGCGCDLELRIADERIIGARAEAPAAWNGVSLCAKGRYGLSFVNHPDRLGKPLERTPEGWQETEWDEALQAIAARLRRILDERGPSAVGIFASGKSTNEENYLMQKFARAVLGTNNVDHCARL